MKTKMLLQTIGLTFLMMLLTTLFTNAQIPIQGIDADNEGFAVWDADGSGPELEGYGHPVPWGWGTARYYCASKDYDGINPAPDAAFCHFLDGITGFPFFLQALADNGFTPGQVKVKLGLLSVKDDIEGEDWFTIDNMHYYNRYAAYYFIELNGEPMISGYMNYINCFVKSIDNYWQGKGNFSSPFDASANSSLAVKEVASAFLTDMDGQELRFIIENATATGPFGGSGRIDGTLFNIVSGYLEKGLPELPFSGLASNHQGLACWDADGSGPEPEAYGHTYEYEGTTGSIPYYAASRDYDGIDPDINASAGYFTDDLMKGFPNLKIQLEYRGYTFDQLKLKIGMGTLGNDIEDVDWGYDGSIHWYNSYGYNITIELMEEPILEYFTDTNYSTFDIAMMDYWYCNSSFSKMTDISSTASINAQYVAMSFLKDLGGHSIGSYLKGYYGGDIPEENGRIDGVFQQFEESKLIARQPTGTHIWAGEVSGTWSIQNSPYIIMDEISVPDGEVLNIDPGVVVKFNTTKALMIYGCIKANGTAEDTILFTACDESVPWGGIGIPNNALTNDPIVFNHCIFEYSYAYNQDNLYGYNCGGAIRIDNYEQVEISHCTFRYNSADNFLSNNPCGGAVMISNCSIPISHCIFHNNSSPWGGAIALLDNSNPVIDNCLFYNNESVHVNGGGGAVLSWENSSPYFVNCTFADNYASDAGGAVELELGGTSTFTNCIFWGNTADIGANQISIWVENPPSLNVYYCDVEDGLDGITPGFQGNYEGNINEDPEFLGPLGGEPYYAISSSSFCINKGTLENPYIPPDWTCPLYCLCGNPRVYGWEIDMGSYETLVTRVNDMAVQNSVSFNVYPNPINSNPTIELNIENDIPVQVSILDIHGRIVSKILIVELQKGNNQVSWNAEKLSPGIYFCQLQIGNEKITRKVVKIE